MTGWLAGLDGLAVTWSESILRACWQGGLALGLAWILDRTLPRLTPAVRCWMWRLAYTKLILAFFCVTPLDLPLLPPAISGREAPQAQDGAAAAESPEPHPPMSTLP